MTPPRFPFLLGTDPRQRSRLKTWATTALIYTACVVLQWQTVLAGRTEPAAAVLLTVMIYAGLTAFYFVIRLGLNLRLEEPALTQPQMVFAMVAIAIAYASDPHVRGVLLAVVALVLMFGAFTLTPRQNRRLGWIATAILAVPMALGAWRDPVRYEPAVEAVTFVFMVVIMPTVAYVTGQLSQLRLDNRRQRGELRDAIQRMEALALHDEMTGLPNRRNVQEWIAHQLSRNRRSGAALCVAIVDLDHFKRVNDTLGHSIGDEVLKTFARHARAALRESDVLARWGGEEFLLVMPDTAIAAGEAAVERLRELLSRPSVWATIPGGAVTFSAGLTSQVSGQTFDQTLQRADAALYRAKDAGRDRIAVA